MRSTAAALIALLFAAVLAADDLPIVKTKFVITGTSFPTGLKEQQTNAERDIGAAIARLGKDNYPFFDWREGSESGQQAAMFIVTLREEEVGGTRAAFYLDYRRVVAGLERRPTDLKLGVTRELYTAGKRSKPYRDPVMLQQDVIARLTEELDSAHKSDFENTFIAKIALCTCKPSVKQDHTIVIEGVSWETMKATRESILYVDVMVGRLPADGSVVDFISVGHVRLTDLEPADAGIGGHLGHIRCATVDTSDWDPRIMSALDRQRIQKFSVYVQHYEFDASTRPAQNP